MLALPDGEELPRFGPYILLSLLGEGGMARVYRAAREGPLGFRKELAIKRIRPDLTRKNESLVRALVNEARLGGQLRHPNIVDVYEFGVVGEEHYLAMEYVPGLTLDALIDSVRRRRTRLPASVVLDLGRQICDGLAYAHGMTDPDGEALNLIHRDLKPANIILSSAGQAKIMDFGIARSTSALHQTTADHTAKGTLRYMSPEQLDTPKKLDLRSDIFAVGSILFEALTGKPLLEGPSLQAIMWQLVNSGYQQRLGAIDLLLPEIRPVLERCLAQDREARYPDAGELGDDLRRLNEDCGSGLGCRELMALVSSLRDQEQCERVSDQLRERSGDSGERSTDWSTFIDRISGDTETLGDDVYTTDLLDVSATSLVTDSKRRLNVPTEVAPATVLWQSADGAAGTPGLWTESRTWVVGLAAGLAVLLGVVGVWRPWEGEPGAGGRPAGSGSVAETEAETESEAETETESEAESESEAEAETETETETEAESEAETESETAPGRRVGEEREEATPEPVVGPPVRVWITSSPWSTWTLSGDAEGSGTETPFERRLPPGRYRVVLREPTGGKSHEFSFQLTGDGIPFSACWNFGEERPCER